MTSPDHAENAGDNLRRAAQQQAEEQEGDQQQFDTPPSEVSGFATPPLEGPTTDAPQLKPSARHPAWGGRADEKYRLGTGNSLGQLG